ncbi:MAG: ATP-dependent DNA helicase [Lachnospiraceae bacterium]|nr:ATP-dependent DNA helicase [Lachnospiraceae bacterium]
MNTTKEVQRISVRSLVEFIMRDGDIDNRHKASPEDAMQEGSRIHRMIQRQMGADYQAEVSLKYLYETEHYILSVEGRADGIVDTAEMVMIDEIKGTYRELFRMKEAVGVHVAQAKCYAYMYSRSFDEEKRKRGIQIRMTYCNMDTEEIKYFEEQCSVEEIEVWFGRLLTEYKKWADYQYDWRVLRNNSIKELEFPFVYREGQKDLVTYVYQTIYHQRKLFLEAPTGVGKTISTIFPAIKAMERNMGEKIFYLTAKTITRTVADNTFQLLRENGLKFKSIVLTAKEKICFCEKPECNPDACPYAKGHFDRVNDAMYDMLTTEENFSRENIERYARKHQVCPFEFALDMSLYSDGIIGDYNYLFDPHVYLKRFFAESKKGNYLFLVDEAHNLLERGREMYSAALVKEEFMQLRRHLKEGLEKEKGRKNVLYGEGYASKMEKQLGKCNKQLLALKRECESYRVVEEIDAFVLPLIRLGSIIESYLEENDEGNQEIKEEILDLYFKVSHFLEMYEILDEKYIKYTQLREDGCFMLKLFCVDPSNNLKACMKKGRSTILFSATLLPIQYYKALLGGEPEDYEVYAKSVFDEEKRLLLIAGDVTSKYTRRTNEEFYKIARYIDEIVRTRQGNYMVFCPSYAFMQEIYECYMENFGNDEKECIVQTDSMNEEEREAFLARFSGNEDLDLENHIFMDIDEDDEKTLIGFCLLGGIFGEGIDLKKDSLIGAVIIGTGLPQVCFERELLKEYFDAQGNLGFDYSYRYPGMNKVLQAAGRVIRTAEDVGVIALLDERFLQGAYQKLFPREWRNYSIIRGNYVRDVINEFWVRWS